MTQAILDDLAEEGALALEDVRAWLLENMDRGARCHCCNQFVKVYNRKLNSGMAACLVVLNRLQKLEPGQWLYVPDLVQAHPVLANSREYPKLRYWGLVETRETDDPDKKDSGYWRVTELGGEFAEGRVTIPSHVRIYDRRLLDFSGEDVDIEACLGNKFSYRELMES
jgi:hypothetical protein